MKATLVYPRKFYRYQHTGSNSSAIVVVPYVLELVHPGNGIDGEYVDMRMLCISEWCFEAKDISKPFVCDRTYDLAVSLEVAEHLAPEHAEDFIDSLTRLAPIILFSAAIPRQGGTHHVNEQWIDY